MASSKRARSEPSGDDELEDLATEFKESYRDVLLSASKTPPHDKPAASGAETSLRLPVYPDEDEVPYSARQLENLATSTRFAFQKASEVHPWKVAFDNALHLEQVRIQHSFTDSMSAPYVKEKIASIALQFQQRLGSVLATPKLNSNPENEQLERRLLLLKSLVTCYEKELDGWEKSLEQAASCFAHLWDTSKSAVVEFPSESDDIKMIQHSLQGEEQETLGKRILLRLQDRLDKLKAVKDTFQRVSLETSDIVSAFVHDAFPEEAKQSAKDLVRDLVG